MVQVVIVLLLNVAGLSDQRVFVVGGECIFCGFLDVIGGDREVFEGGDGVGAEEEGRIPGDGGGAEPEKPAEGIRGV